MAKIDDLAKQVATLTDIVTKLVEDQKAAPKVEVKAVPAVSVESAIPVPADYRSLVDSILNQSFGIDLKPASDVAAFDFAILVPQSYSNAGKPHWETYKEDRRSRVILSALGLNGVREWVQKVYDNFDAETKTRITMDRTPL